ncbi:MAG: hypothetical protein V5A84_00330 [Planctomycetota bacterium]
MEAVNDIFLHLDTLVEALDLLLLPGLVYAAVRGWKHLEGVHYGVLVALAVIAGYVAVFAIGATEWVQTRYYRPIIPFAALVAALGYYCLALDVRDRRILYPLLGLVVLACSVDLLHAPIRSIAGRSLRPASGWRSMTRATPAS